MDSDLQHDPSMLPALVHAVEDGADLAIGSRYVPGGSVPGWKYSRRLISQGGNIYAAMVLGMHVRDSTSGFRAYSASALTDIDLPAVRADGYGFQIEMAYAVACNGGRIVEVPITFGSRERGLVQDVELHRGRGPRPGDVVGGTRPRAQARAHQAHHPRRLTSTFAGIEHPARSARTRARHGVGAT